VITSSSPLSVSILKAYEAKHIGGAGYGFLLSSSAAWFTQSVYKKVPVITDGLLYLAEAGAETATSRAEYEGTGLVAALRQIYTEGDKLKKSGLSILTGVKLR
jgi:hypothetical protein